MLADTPRAAAAVAVLTPARARTCARSVALIDPRQGTRRCDFSAETTLPCFRSDGRDHGENLGHPLPCRQARRGSLRGRHLRRCLVDRRPQSEFPPLLADYVLKPIEAGLAAPCAENDPVAVTVQARDNVARPTAQSKPRCRGVDVCGFGPAVRQCLFAPSADRDPIDRGRHYRQRRPKALPGGVSTGRQLVESVLLRFGRAIVFKARPPARGQDLFGVMSDCVNSGARFFEARPFETFKQQRL